MILFLDSTQKSSKYFICTYHVFDTHDKFISQKLHCPLSQCTFSLQTCDISYNVPPLIATSGLVSSLSLTAVSLELQAIIQTMALDGFVNNKIIE